MIVDNHSDDEDEPTNWDDDESDADINRPSFPCLHQAIQDAIEHLGGNVFPKMNWSAPRDAAWMGFGNSLKCNSPEQVLPYFLICGCFSALTFLFIVGFLAPKGKEIWCYIKCTKQVLVRGCNRSSSIQWFLWCTWLATTFQGLWWSCCVLHEKLLLNQSINT